MDGWEVLRQLKSDDFGDQVVNQDRGVRLCPVEDERRLALHLERAVDPSHDSLTRGLFVAGRAIDLARKEES